MFTRAAANITTTTDDDNNVSTNIPNLWSRHSESTGSNQIPENK